MSDLSEIRYRELHKFFHRRHLLDHLSLSLKGGTATLLSGENGSGKTTLLRILSGLEKPARCTVDFGLGGTWSKPRPWSKCRKQLQQQVMYLHQQPYLFDGNVIRNLGLALPRTMPRVQRNRKIGQALEWAQLDELKHARAKTLSGGEKQRVSLARAWLRRARILLLDEPIANMDRESQARTVALLKRLKNARAALMISSHNHEIFNELIDHRLILDRGKLFEAPVLSFPDNVTPLAKENAFEEDVFDEDVFEGNGPKEGASEQKGAGNASR